MDYIICDQAKLFHGNIGLGFTWLGGLFAVVGEGELPVCGWSLTTPRVQSRGVQSHVGEFLLYRGSGGPFRPVES